MKNLNTHIVSNTKENVTEIWATDIHNLSMSILCTEKKWNKMCRKLASQIWCGNKSSFKSVIMSAIGILQKQYIHGLKHDITIAPHSLLLLYNAISL